MPPCVVRNALGTFGAIKEEDNNLRNIEWKYIDKLFK